MSQATTSGSQRSHISVLDGVRGLAILLVMARHQAILSNGSWLDNLYLGVCGDGWAGVDLFFVLSGFLITRILLAAKESPHYFRNFYIRRTLRIFPLYYAVLFAAGVLIPLLPHSGSGPFADAAREYSAVHDHAAWFWAYLANVYFALHGFAGKVSVDLMWSLSVEEQFYLLWPTVVLLLSRRNLGRACIGIGVCALLLRVLVLANGGEVITASVLTPMRMDSLAAGALLAVWEKSGTPFADRITMARRALVVSGIVVAALLIGTSDRTVAMFGYSALGFFFATLVATVLGSPPDSVLRRAFEARWLRAVGRYAYALYLFHAPVQSAVSHLLHLRPESFPALFGSHLPGQLVFNLTASGLTFAAAAVSWNLFEKRFLDLKDRFAPAAR